MISQVTTPLIELASNENPFGPSPKALAAMQEVLGYSHLYPDNDASELQKKIADMHTIRPEQVLIGAGSTELISIIARTLLRPGLKAITSQRSFIVYSLATSAVGAQLVRTPMRDDGFDLDAIASAVDPETKVIFLANPNNPTGTVFGAIDADKFLSSIPEEVIVILDEAYYEYAAYFAAQRGFRYSHSSKYLREKANVVVLRTFSKVHGLAGLRIGYALGPPELLQRFAEMRSTYSISLPAQVAAAAALEDKTHVQKSVAANASGAAFLSNALVEMGFHPSRTWANFIYCDIQTDGEELSQRMAAQGVLIRALGPWGAPQAVRISIGTAEQNDAFLLAFRKAMTGN
jgi:histidinol-phosphate aminotransferase